MRGGRVVAVRGRRGLAQREGRAARGAPRAAALRTLPGATVTASGTLRATLHPASGERVALRTALAGGRLGTITLTLIVGRAR